MEKPVESATGTGVGQLSAFAFLLGVAPQAITEAAITASLPEIARDLGENGEFTAQMLMLTGMLGLVFGALFSGKILELAGSRRTYVFGALFFLLFGIAGSFLHNVPLLFASRILTGFAASCIATTAMWGVAAQFGKESRPKSFGYAGSIAGLLAILSVVVGGLLTQQFGWRASFWQFGVLGLLLLPIAMGGVEQIKPEGIRQGQPGHFRRLLPVYVQTFMLYAVIGVFSVQLPFLADEAGLTDAGARSLIQAIPGTGVIVGGALFGLLTSRFGSKTTIILTAASIIAACLVLVFNRSVPALALAAAGVGLCMGLAMPWLYNVLSQRTPPQMVGRYMGYMTAFTFIGAFSNPFWAMPLKGALGASGLFAVGATIAAMMLVFAVQSLNKEQNS
jgi:MFS transporter, ACDE family, multidrug resistance protein